VNTTESEDGSAGPLKEALMVCAAAGMTGGAAGHRRSGRGGTAAQVFDTYGERVGTGLVMLLAIFRPDRVIVAGSAARFLDLFGQGLQRSLDHRPKYTPRPAVVAAELGDLSGAIGAAVMAREFAPPPRPLARSGSRQIS
jgi:hypothetical protein